jgi:hypothetical protein
MSRIPNRLPLLTGYTIPASRSVRPAQGIAHFCFFSRRFSNEVLYGGYPGRTALWFGVSWNPRPSVLWQAQQLVSGLRLPAGRTSCCGPGCSCDDFRGSVCFGEIGRSSLPAGAELLRRSLSRQVWWITKFPYRFRGKTVSQRRLCARSLGMALRFSIHGRPGSPGLPSLFGTPT